MYAAVIFGSERQSRMAAPPPYMAMKNVDVGCGLRGLLVPANFMSQSAQLKSDSRETEVGT